MRGIRFVAFVLTATIAFWGASARAAQIPWKTPSGTAGGFDYNNGGTSDELFVPHGTDPVVTPTGLAFFPSAFKAQAGGGTTQQVSDKLSFDLHAHTGNELKQFVVNEFGDYTIQGTGPNTAVKVFGTLFLTNLDTNEVRFDTLHTTPVAIGTGQGVTSGQGVWSGSESLNLVTSPNIPTGWHNVRVELDNILQVTSDVGTNAFIEKKIVTPGVTIDIVQPEPGSAALLAIGSACLFGRRRKTA